MLLRHSLLPSSINLKCKKWTQRLTQGATVCVLHFLALFIDEGTTPQTLCKCIARDSYRSFTEQVPNPKLGRTQVAAQAPAALECTVRGIYTTRLVRQPSDTHESRPAMSAPSV